MKHPIWIVLAWSVVVFAAWLKLKRLSGMLLKQRPKSPTSIDAVRASLERIWKKEAVL